MKSKRLWTLAAAATVLLTLTLAAQGDEYTIEFNPDLDLRYDLPYFERGGMANFDVEVAPWFLGGHADLYVEGGDGVPHFVQSFPLDQPLFPVMAPVPMPHEVPGPTLTYYYEAFLPDGLPGGTSTHRRRPDPGLEWE